MNMFILISSSSQLSFSFLFKKWPLNDFIKWSWLLLKDCYLDLALCVCDYVFFISSSGSYLLSIVVSSWELKTI